MMAVTRETGLDSKKDLQAGLEKSSCTDCEARGNSGSVAGFWWQCEHSADPITRLTDAIPQHFLFQISRLCMLFVYVVEYSIYF